MTRRNPAGRASSDTACTGHCGADHPGGNPSCTDHSGADPAGPCGKAALGKAACLRPAVPGDCDVLYAWANDPLVRKNSFRQEPIAYNTHVEWFRRMMADDHTRQYILVADGRAAGQIRVAVSEYDETAAEIGYSIAPDCRGRGYGSLLLRLAGEAVLRDLPQVRTLIARIKESNAPSIAAVRKAGYACIPNEAAGIAPPAGAGSGYLTYVRTLEPPV